MSFATSKTDLLKTFVQSEKEESDFYRYEAKLGDVPSLKALAENGKPRSIDNLTSLANSNSFHTKKLLELGYQSSYTVPLRMGDSLLGFLFFDSPKPHYFNGNSLLG